MKPPEKPPKVTKIFRVSADALAQTEFSFRDSG
jgi:hypothetical protein